MVDSMNPILFSENSTTWNTNGLGRLSDAISCKVKEQRNGEYELELTYPTSGKHFSDISIRKIIAAIPSQGSTLQPFRIYRITRPIRGKVTVKARHISYDLSKYVCTPFSAAASPSACASVLSNLKSRSVKSCPFSFWTDVTTIASYSQMTPASIRQRLGGIEGSVLDQFGGEYEWDGLTVKLHRQRGTVTNYTLRYGKNITDVNQDENIAETATGVVPFWSDVEGTTVITGDVIEKQDISYSSPLIIPLDLSSEWQTAPTVAQLNTAATVYVNKSDFGIPKVSVDVSFVNLADTEEYKNILPMQSLHLCDTVKVQFEELGIDTTAKVVETVYDVLAERYESIQIGSLKSSLAGLITDYEASMAQTVSDTGKRVFAEANTEAQDLINNATAWLTASGGYVIAVKNNDGSWKELLFLDTNDVQTAHNVLRINQNGIGFSSNGVGGPYTQAWTLDGRLVIGGTNVPSITCYDSNNNILFQANANGVQVNKGDIILRDANNNIVFQASSNGIIWNATNSSMDSSGKITASNAELTGGYIKLGGSADGKIEMYNSSNQKVGEWTRDRLRFQNGGSNTIDLMKDGGNSVIKFDDESYIDGTGTGTNGGINFNARKCVFSVNDLGVTSSRGSSTVRYGRDGNVITSLSTATLSGICCNLRSDGGGFSWDIVDIEFVNGWGSHNTVSGLVVS